MRVIRCGKSHRHLPVLDHPECSIRRFARRPRQRRNAQESVACIFSCIQIRLLLHSDHLSLLIGGRLNRLPTVWSNTAGASFRSLRLACAAKLATNFRTAWNLPSVPRWSCSRSLFVSRRWKNKMAVQRDCLQT